MMSRHAQTDRATQRCFAQQANMNDDLKPTRAPRSKNTTSMRRWAIRKLKVMEKFISNDIMGGTDWRDDEERSVYVSTLLSKLFNKNPKLLYGIVTEIGNAHQAFRDVKAEVEADVCGDIQQHLDKVAGPLYALLNLTETGYQKLINSLSWKYDHAQERHRRIRFKWGTRKPRLMSQHTMRAAKKRFMTTIGLVRAKNEAYVDAATVLIRRIRLSEFLCDKAFLCLPRG